MLRLKFVRGPIQLPLPQLEYLFQLVLNYDELPPDDTEIGCREALLIWTIDLLASVRLLQPPEQPVVASRLYRALLPHAASLVHAVQQQDFSDIPDFPIGFADRRYLSIMGDPRVYDLQTGRAVESADKPLETLVYNLGKLFARTYAKCQKLEREHARDQATPASPTAVGAERS